MQISFRYANNNDTPLILSFINELAKYEQMLDEVIATETLLNEWLFKKEAAEVIFIMENKKEIGFALFSITFQPF